MQSGKQEEKAFCLEEFLNSPLDDDDPMTVEEIRYSTPYSDRESWALLIMGELVDGRNREVSRFKGPPGMWAEMESLLASTSRKEMEERVMKRLPLIADTPPADEAPQ